ncbi:MAG TPA: hypothetical protein VFR92_04560 [Sphingomicrobium sp.]|jgi:ElaB/YqjD/DUF883 family membrane-anchored ribosome-binding protein|nr:hypothetical protein [Sphingomicrobium sp.]
MSDNRTAALPDGTDTVIEGAAKTEDGGTVTADTSLVREQEIAAPKGDAERPVTGSGRPEGGLEGDSSGGSTSAGSSGSLADRLRSGREQFSSQAGERARGMVTQGLERTSEALANIAKMVGDTAPGIEERLGSDYGDYARRAAGAIENVANTIAEKDPDELIEDTRNFVRNSPGVALAGAAVVGFVLTRLLKSGLGSARDKEDDDS